MTAPDPTADLPAQERQVAEKYLAAVQAMTPQLPPLAIESWFDTTASKLETVLEPLPPGTLQFPREQWIVRPNRRALALAMADAVLDKGHVAEAGWLLFYGGRERVA